MNIRTDQITNNNNNNNNNNIIINNNEHKRERSFWNSVENQRNFLDDLFKKLKFKSLDDWSYLSATDLRKYGGGSLLNKYNNKWFTALRSIYPKHHWDLSLFKKMPNGFWKSHENQKLFLDRLFHQLKLKSMEEWYSVTTKEVINHGGMTLLKMFDLCFFRALCNVYPEYEWSLWKSSSRLKYRQPNTLSFYLSFLQKQFLVQKKEDWLRISNQLKTLAGNSGRENFNLGNLRALLMKKYPNEKWEAKLFTQRHKRSKQRWLFVCLTKIYPNHWLIEDYFDPVLQEMSVQVYFDIFIPALFKVFEYNGEQHFDDIPSGFSSIETYQSKDIEKRDAAKLVGIEVIDVPFWWDYSLASLRRTIIPSF